MTRQQAAGRLPAFLFQVADHNLFLADYFRFVGI
jgi:hypothetical protein